MRRLCFRWRDFARSILSSGGRRHANQKYRTDRKTVTAPESPARSPVLCFFDPVSFGSRSHDTRRRMRIVIEDRREPALAFGDRPALAPRIILDLVALDLADAEIGALRMAEIKPAHGRTRPHCEAFG